MVGSDNFIKFCIHDIVHEFIVSILIRGVVVLSTKAWSLAVSLACFGIIVSMSNRPYAGKIK